MAEQRNHTNHCVVPAQIWINLPVELKMKVIWLLSQLAFNVINTHSEKAGKELGDVTISSK